MCIGKYRQELQDDNKATHQDDSCVLEPKSNHDRLKLGYRGFVHNVFEKRCNWWVAQCVREEFYTSHGKLNNIVGQVHIKSRKQNVDVIKKDKKRYMKLNVI